MKIEKLFVEEKWFQKGKINRYTEGCISENQMTEFKVILAGMTVQSLNLKEPIGWPLVERVSITRSSS